MSIHHKKQEEAITIRAKQQARDTPAAPRRRHAAPHSRPPPWILRCCALCTRGDACSNQSTINIKINKLVLVSQRLQRVQMLSWQALKLRLLFGFFVPVSSIFFLHQDKTRSPFNRRICTFPFLLETNKNLRSANLTSHNSPSPSPSPAANPPHPSESSDAASG